MRIKLAAQIAIASVCVTVCAASGQELAVASPHPEGDIDPAELSFEFDQPTLFEDPESRREMYVDPSKAREGYLRKLEAHLAGVRSSCERLGITYRQFSTDTPLESALSEFLRSRLHKNSRPVGHRRNQGRRAL